MSLPQKSASADLLALEDQVCFALAVAARSVIAVHKPLLAELGLTHPQYLVMLALWADEPLSVGALSARLQLEPGTLSPLLKRLEQAGLLTRRRDPADERALRVALTPRGRALRERAERVPPTVLDRLGLDLDELVELRTRLGRVTAAARAALDAEYAEDAEDAEVERRDRPSG